MSTKFVIPWEWREWLREDPLIRWALLDRGWMSGLPEVELAFIISVLKANPSLRREWGLRRRFTGDEVRKVVCGITDGQNF